VVLGTYLHSLFNGWVDKVAMSTKAIVPLISRGEG